MALLLHVPHVGRTGKMASHAIHTVASDRPALRAVMIHLLGQPVGEGRISSCGMAGIAVQPGRDRRRNMVADLAHRAAVLGTLCRVRAVVACIAARRRDNRVAHGGVRKRDYGRAVIDGMAAAAIAGQGSDRNMPGRLAFCPNTVVTASRPTPAGCRGTHGGVVGSGRAQEGGVVGGIGLGVTLIAGCHRSHVPSRFARSGRTVVASRTGTGRGRVGAMCVARPQERGVIGRIGLGMTSNAIRRGRYVGCALPGCACSVVACVAAARDGSMRKGRPKEGRVVVRVCAGMATAVAAIQSGSRWYVECWFACRAYPVMACRTGGRCRNRRNQVVNGRPQPRGEIRRVGMAGIALPSARQMGCGFALSSGVLSRVTGRTIASRRRCDVVVFRPEESRVSGGERSSVTDIALCGGRYMVGRFSHHAEVNPVAGIAHPRHRGRCMVETRTQESGGAKVAGFARGGRDDMQACGRLADNITAELSTVALVAPAHDTGVIHCPACESCSIGMASLARLRGGEVPGRTLAYDAQILPVVAGCASACDTDVIEEFHLETGWTGMARIARLACRDMWNRLGRSTDTTAGGMAPFTVSRGVFEDAVHVTLFAS